MASLWWIIANYLLPVPAILFLLLAIPGPRNIRRGILLFCTKVFDLQLVGMFKLLHVALFLTMVACLASLRQLQAVKEQHALSVFTSPNQEIALLSKKWRSERNLWISVFALSAWLGLAAFYREKQRRIQLEEQLQEQGLAAGSPVSGVPAGPQKPHTQAPAAQSEGLDRPQPAVAAQQQSELAGELELENLATGQGLRAAAAGAEPLTTVAAEEPAKEWFQKKDD